MLFRRAARFGRCAGERRQPREIPAEGPNRRELFWGGFIGLDGLGWGWISLDWLRSSRVGSGQIGLDSVSLDFIENGLGEDGRPRSQPVRARLPRLRPLGMAAAGNGRPKAGVVCRLAGAQSVVSSSRRRVVLFDMVRHDGGERNTEVGPRIWSERNYYSGDFCSGNPLGSPSG